MMISVTPIRKAATRFTMSDRLTGMKGYAVGKSVHWSAEPCPMILSLLIAYGFREALRLTTS